MDAAGIDLQVLSHTVPASEAFLAEQAVRLAQRTNEEETCESPPRGAPGLALSERRLVASDWPRETPPGRVAAQGPRRATIRPNLGRSQHPRRAADTQRAVRATRVLDLAGHRRSISPPPEGLVLRPEEGKTASRQGARRPCGREVSARGAALNICGPSKRLAAERQQRRRRRPDAQRRDRGMSSCHRASRRRGAGHG
jgi:hypothetical protein